MRFINRLALAIAMTVTAATAYAHHSFDAEYDSKKPITLTGYVTKLDWLNPHAFVYLDVRDDSGAVRNYKVEMGPPYALTRGGWKRDTLKIGDVVTVEGSKAKNGTPTGNARSVVLASTGQRLFAGSSQGNTGAAQ